MVHKDHNIGVESSASSKQDGYARIVLQLILNCDFNISEDMGCFFFWIQVSNLSSYWK